jgi:PST family polysaccharide transporter
VTSPARATGILAIGTAASLIAGVAVAKSLALLTGPQGLGLYALLQSLLGLAGIVFGLGVGTGIVRATASAAAAGDAGRAVALWRAAMGIAAAGGLVGGTALVLFRVPIAAAFLGGRGYAWAVVVLAPALLLQLVASVEAGYLNGHQRVRALAMVTGGSSLLGAAVMVALVARWGVGALPAAFVASAAGSVLVVAGVRRRSLGSMARVAGQIHSADAARWLAGFGAPYTVSQLVGTGVQLLVPVIVLTVLDRTAVGYVQAASAIAMGYLSFLLTAMAQD